MEQTARVKICQHGVEIDSCSFCNGYIFKEDVIREMRRVDGQLRDERRKMEAHTRLLATRHNAPYSDAEFKYIIVNTFEVEKKNVVVLYKIALNLSRTLGAVEWIWNYIWAEDITDILKEGIDNAMWERIQKLKDEVFKPNI